MTSGEKVWKWATKHGKPVTADDIVRALKLTPRQASDRLRDQFSMGKMRRVPIPGSKYFRYIPIPQDEWPVAYEREYEAPAFIHSVRPELLPVVRIE